VDVGEGERFCSLGSKYEAMESMWSTRRRRSSGSVRDSCCAGVGEASGFERGMARVMVAGSKKA